MKKKIKMMQTFFCTLMIATISFSVANAQDAISEKDLQAIDADFKAISSKIEAALKTDMTLYNSMMSQLKSIDSKIDTTGKSAALLGYKTKFATSYGSMVKKAGVDLNSFIKTMNNKYTSYIFTVHNLYAVSFKRKSNAPIYKRGSTTQTPTTTTQPITSFIQSKDQHCALLAGSNVAFGTKSVEATSTAVVLGGCSTTGRLKKDVTVPSNAISATLQLKFKLEVSGYAIGVLGSSGCSGNASVYVYNNFFYIGETTIAPICWVSSMELSEEFDLLVDVIDSKGSTVLIDAIAHTDVIGVLSPATSSSAKVSITTANLIVTK